MMDPKEELELDRRIAEFNAQKYKKQTGLSGLFRSILLSTSPRLYYKKIRKPELEKLREIGLTIM